MNMHNPAILPDPLPTVETPAPPTGLLVADYFEQGPGYRSRRSRGTGDWLITVTVAGAGCYRIGGETFLCRPGDVMLLLPGAPHDYGTDPEAERWVFYWAHFLPRPAWDEWLLWRELAPGLRTASVAGPAALAQLEAAFRRLLDAAAGLDAWGERLAENALEEVVLLIARADAQAAGGATDPRVLEVLRELGRRYHEPLTVAGLAQGVHLSPSRLAHLFTENVGVSPIQALLQLRLRHAARLLEFSTLSVAQIAAEVGFESPFYFSRQFRARFGVSPSGYRARAR
jgi:AraC family transcriptional regulator of arabinose operon